MRLFLPAFFLLCVKALKIADEKLIANDTFDHKRFDTDEHQNYEDGTPLVPMFPEMYHLDVHTSRQGDMSSISNNYVIYFSVTGACFAGIALMYQGRGLSIVLAIITFLASISLMSNLIRNIYLTGDFHYPLFITCSHQLSTCLAGFIILLSKQATMGQKINYPTGKTMMTSLGPVGFCVAGSLGFSNLGLLYTNTHFYEMIAPLNGLATFGIGILLGHRTSIKLLPPVICVVIGLPLVVAPEPNISFIGLAFILSAVLCRSGKAWMQSLLMSHGMSQSFDPIELSCWSAISTFVIMIIWSIIAEGLAPWKALWHAPVLVAVFMSCIAAVVLNVSGLFILKDMGPVAQQIISEFKGVLASLGAVAAFGEVITPQQWVCYALTVIGIYWYNQTDKQIQQEAKEEENLVSKEQSEKA